MNNVCIVTVYIFIFQYYTVVFSNTSFLKYMDNWEFATTSRKAVNTTKYKIPSKKIENY